MWPHVRTLAVTIVGLSESDVDDMHDFMESTLGQEIGLTDWEGRLWKGIITNPNEAATQDSRTDGLSRSSSRASCSWLSSQEITSETATDKLSTFNTL